MRTVIAVPVWVLICFAVGLLASYFQNDALTMWYPLLRRSSITPPNIVFPIVWSILYLLMGISAAAVWKQKRGRNVFENGLFVYAISLFVNFWWSILFFELRYFLFSFIWLLLLWVLILMTVLAYNAVDRRSALLQLPYLAWVTFAGYLNFGIALLNPR